MTELFSQVRPPASAAARLARLNWVVVALTTAIAGIGVASLYSVADGNLSPWADKHALRFMLALAMALTIAMTPLQVWARLAYPAYAVALLLVALVPLVGTEAMGAKRWIQGGGMSFQPTELMKVALAAALARYYQWLDPRRVSHPVWVAIPLAMIAIPVVFTLRQPDLGTAMMLAGVGLGVMFLAGVNLLYFAAGAGSAILALPVALLNLHDYQRRRIEIFLDPEQDPLGAGYHISQSKIAIGSGGWTGKGYMQGTQSQLDFLPEKHTDFIFTMFAEEWGFWGALFLIGLYAALLVTLVVMAMQVRSPFSRLLIAASGLALFIYVAVNVAMVTGLAPVVGVPLPLVSFGGTAMVTLMVSLGLALCAHVQRGEELRRGDLGPFW